MIETARTEQTTIKKTEPSPESRLKPQEVRSALQSNTLDLDNLERALGNVRTVLANGGLKELASTVPSSIVRKIKVSGDSGFRVGGESVGRTSGPLFSGLVDTLNGKLTNEQLIGGVKSEGYGVSALAQVLVRMDAVAVALEKLSDSGNPVALTCAKALRAQQTTVQGHIRMALEAIEKCQELAPVGSQIRTQLERAVSSYAGSFYEKGSTVGAERILNPTGLLCGKRDRPTVEQKTVELKVSSMPKIQK